MRPNKICSIVLISFLFIISCKKQDIEQPLPQQNIIYSDTSSVTGELTIQVYYKYTNNVIYIASSGFWISLYVTYEDLMNDLYIYTLPSTNNGRAYFGYINYGNYYVKAEGYLENQYYEGIAALQVRPRRSELVNVTVYLTNP